MSEQHIDADGMEQNRELRIPIVIPARKQIILHQLPSQPARLFASERPPRQSREATAWSHLAGMGMNHLKPYSSINAGEEVEGYALAWGLDRPVAKPSGLKEGRLGVFSIDRLLGQRRRFDETDIMIVEALARIIDERRP